MVPLPTPTSSSPVASFITRPPHNVTTFASVPCSAVPTTPLPYSGSEKAALPPKVPLRTSYETKPSTNATIVMSIDMTFLLESKTPWPTMHLVCLTCLTHSFSHTLNYIIHSLAPGASFR
jgi:hypothetical protein